MLREHPRGAGWAGGRGSGQAGSAMAARRERWPAASAGRRWQPEQQRSRRPSGAARQPTAQTRRGPRRTRGRSRPTAPAAARAGAAPARPRRPAHPAPPAPQLPAARACGRGRAAVGSRAAAAVQPCPAVAALPAPLHAQQQRPRAPKSVTGLAGQRRQPTLPPPPPPPPRAGPRARGPAPAPAPWLPPWRRSRRSAWPRLLPAAGTRGPRPRPPPRCRQRGSGGCSRGDRQGGQLAREQLVPQQPAAQALASVAGAAALPGRAQAAPLSRLTCWPPSWPSWRVPASCPAAAPRHTWP
jgi:hypothetical protein